MGLILVILGLLLSGYGAALMLVSGGAVAGRGDEAGLRRARRRSRRALALLVLGVVLVVIGALVLPLRNRLAGLGTGGVLVLIFCDVLALVLNAVGIAIVSMSGIVWGRPVGADEPRLARAQGRTRVGLAVLLAGIATQIAAVAVIAF